MPLDQIKPIQYLHISYSIAIEFFLKGISPHPCVKETPIYCFAINGYLQGFFAFKPKYLEHHLWEAELVTLAVVSFI